MPKSSKKDAYSSIKGFSMQEQRYLSYLLDSPDSSFTYEGFSQDIEGETSLIQVKFRESDDRNIKEDIQKLYEDSRKRGLGGKVDFCSPDIDKGIRMFTKQELVEDYNLGGEEESLSDFSNSFSIEYCGGYEEGELNNIIKIREKFFCDEIEAKKVMAEISRHVKSVLFQNKYDYEKRKTTLDHITRELKLSYRYEVLTLLERASRGEDIISSETFLSLPTTAKNHLIHELNLDEDIIPTITKEESDKLQAQMDDFLRSENKQYRYYFPLFFLLDPVYLDTRGEDNRGKLRKLLKIDREKEEDFLQRLEKNGKIKRVGDVMIVMEKEEAETLLKEIVESDQIDFDILTKLFI